MTPPPVSAIVKQSVRFADETGGGVTRLILLAGPTASGKTAVAVRLAAALGTEIISCDSMQVYRSMPILTQAPSKKELGRVRCRLASLLDPSEEYSAARFRDDALKLIASASKKKKIPLVAGGTGLYFRALLDGLFEHEGPSRDTALRERLLAEEAREGAGHLHRRLAKADPASAGKIHPNDLRRVVRALEVFTLTGRPLSEQKGNRSGLRAAVEGRFFLLERDRADLYARIDRRVEVMARAGLVREVKRLLAKNLSVTARMALGVREIASHLDRGVPLADALEALKRNTRRYAKRQISWFRHERGITRVPVSADEKPRETAEKILRLLK